ncbi:amidohydrolase family protein [Corynebacterium lactis]|uniref:amidohydrolase family protein n=1 Tax=Corynebacterium lactis TaxID=1231000 RepID=UPI000A8086FC|nr:amidohydrolase family protein [Corynebacterium lactis]
MGVDVIKIAATGGVTDARSLGEAGRAQLTTEEMSAICEEAHNADKVVAAHVQGEVGLIAALRAGVDTIEHGCQLSPEAIELFHDNPKALRGRSFLVPTLCAALPFAELDQSQTGVSDVVKANGEKIFQGMVDGLSCAIEHDVPLGIGNDSSMTYVTHYDFWRELEAWTLYSGLSRADVLNVATQGNADMLGLTLKGRLEPGKDADLVVVKKSPLEGFDTLASPRMVVARGEIINHPQVERFAEVDTDLDAIFDNLRKNRAA